MSSPLLAAGGDDDTDPLAACRRDPDAVRELKRVAEEHGLDAAADAYAAVLAEVTDGE